MNKIQDEKPIRNIALQIGDRTAIISMFLQLTLRNVNYLLHSALMFPEDY